MSRREFRFAANLALIAALLQAVSGCDDWGTERATLPVAAPSPAALSSPIAPRSTDSVATQPLVSQGLILYGSDYESGRAIWQMNGDGTNKHVLVYDEGVSGWPGWFQWSPNGRLFAYLWTYRQEDGAKRQSVWVADRDGTHQRQVSAPAECAWYRWHCEESLVTYTGTGSVCDRYDPNPGKPRCFVYDPATAEMKGCGFPADYYDYRTYLYSPHCDRVAGLKEGERDLFVLDLFHNTKVTIFSMPKEHFFGEVGSPQWSPDGTKLALSYCYRRTSEAESFCDLYVAEVDERKLLRLTDFEAQYAGRGSPVVAGTLKWAPNGQWLGFLLQIKGESLAYAAVIPAQGGPVTNLGIAWRGGGEPIWSPDSTRLAFISNVQFEAGRFGNPYTDLGQWDIYVGDIHSRYIYQLTNDRAMEMDIDWK